jgi:hypothetical protein
MIPKYLATLATVVVVVTLGASSLRFATNSKVLSGKALDESLPFEFTIDAGENQTYIIDSEMAQFLQTHIGFPTEGPPHVVAAKVEVTPKKVSWTEDRTNYTAPGAAMTVQLHWDTPADSPNGSRGSIYLQFPEVPGLEGKTITLHSGGYQGENTSRYVIREVSTYRSTNALALARFVFALSAGLPFGIMLHSIYWAFVLKSEKRARLSQLPAQGAGLPRTFYPNPIAEWVASVIVFGVGALAASVVAGISVLDGFMSSDMVIAPYIILAFVTVVAILIAYFTSRSVLTVRVGPDSISYARGRENTEWLTATWTDILVLKEKYRKYRGNTTYWIEIEFRDKRKKLKIAQSIEGYRSLRDLLLSKTTR